MQRRLLFSILVFEFFMAASCRKTPDNFTLGDKGYAYYPLEIGKFIEYQMDSTIYDPNGDTTVYQSISFIREEIVDTLTDNLGNTLYRVERYERTADSLPWVIKKVMSAALMDDQAVRTEDNLKFLKMVFPIQKNNRWDGNSHFDNSLIVDIAGESVEMFKGWDYRIAAIGEVAAFGGEQFDETVTVEESDNENLIELRRSNSIYAKDIGLIYRELWILDTQCIDDCIGKNWSEKAEKGFILKQTITNHN